MSLKEALEITINTLCNINVPVAYMNQIGTPIAVSVSNLQACLDAMKQQEVPVDGNADAG